MKHLHTRVLGSLGSLVIAASAFLLSALFLSLPAQAVAPTCNGLPATVYVEGGFIVGGPDNGLAYAGTLTGETSGPNRNDVIVGTSGNDFINGQGGDDTICGGDGDDTIDGGSGKDWIDGEGGNDTIDGGEGKDELFGGAGDDTLYGENGGDDMTGGLGNDFCDQGTGPGADCEAGSGQGSITIIKDASPDSAQDFSFEEATLATFMLDDDADGTLPNTQSFTNVDAGTYTVFEVSIPSNWTLTNIECTGDTDNGTVIDVNAGSVAIDLDEAEFITCTFTNTQTSFQCSDDADNDSDGVADELDPGCWDDPTDSSTYNPNDDDESDATTECQDEADNDGDGLIDLADPGCSSPQDNDESDGTTQCQDGLDNDDDDLADELDPGCWDDQGQYDATDNDESDATTECQDGVDNADNDGVADELDPGCWTDVTDPTTYDPTDDNEGDATTECQDDVDNSDADGVADEADPGCYDDQGQYDATDNDESDATTECQDGVDNADNDGVADELDPGCWSVAGDPNSYDRTDDNEGDGTTECQDDVDNSDDDGVADEADPGCYDDQGQYDATDNDESDATTECQDESDNDNDGATDYPNDFACDSPQDDDESDVLAACQDGQDNDNDGLTDLEDPGCSSPQDNNEADATTECQDGEDNDSDGIADELDPGCWTDPTNPNTYDPTDDDESDATTQCQDGADNDEDDLTDLADPGCSSPYDNDESDGTTECQDGVDNADNDGVADELDPGCWTDPTNPNTYDPTDDDESDATTECQDNIDNADNDGLADENDPGCWDEESVYVPTDNDEGDATTQCQDEVDNDEDGLTDMDDPGCAEPADNNESDEDLDFGDAPDDGEGFNYNTLLANSGARHVIGLLYLGASVDAEADGQPTASALGDDTNTSDDEDGVTFTGTLIPGAGAGVDVVSSGEGYLHAWVDFNQDGDWDDKGEKILDAEAVVTGGNSFGFTVPFYAAVGDTYARFRLASTDTLSYTGRAEDGEVEDMIVSIVADNGVVEISKTATPASVVIGQNVTYTLTISNGKATPQSFSVQDAFANAFEETPPYGGNGDNGGSLTIVTDSVEASFAPEESGSFSGSYPLFYIFDLQPGAVATIEYEALANSEGISFNTTSNVENTASLYLAPEGGDGDGDFSEVVLVPEEPTASDSATVVIVGPTSGGGGGGGGGGSSACSDEADRPDMTDITPGKLAVVNALGEISFVASEEAAPATAKITVNGDVVAHEVETLGNGSYLVSADVSGLNLSGEVLINLYIDAGAGKCKRNAVYYVTVDEEGEESGGVPFEEGPDGSLFSDEGGTLFSDDNRLTRAYVAHIVTEVLGLEGCRLPENLFSDLSSSDEYAEDVCAVWRAGIMWGYNQGVLNAPFRPYFPITRAELLKTLYQATGRRYTPGLEIPCEDLVPGAWNVVVMKSAVADGATSIFSVDRCLPNEIMSSSRFEEMVKMFFGL